VVLLERARSFIRKKTTKADVGHTIAASRVGVGGKQPRILGEFLAPNGAWQNRGRTVLSAPEMISVFRSRIVGGRTNHWGRIALRFARSISLETREWTGDDWPISYDDIAPYLRTKSNHTLGVRFARKR